MNRKKGLSRRVRFVAIAILIASLLTTVYLTTLYLILSHPTLDQQHGSVSSKAPALRTCPCIPEHLAKLKALGIKNSVTYEEWESMLCRPPPDHASSRPLLIGVGPGTTATRSFALAVNLLHFSVSHHGAFLDRGGRSEGKNRKNLARFQVKELKKGTKFRADLCHTADTDIAALHNSVDAIFDMPVPFYALDVSRAHPNAKIIIAHRDPATCAQKRLAHCGNFPVCAAPFVLRPLNMSTREMTDDQNVGSFEATEHVLKCLVPAHNCLQVDAWDPPPKGWMPRIADFLNVTMPPPESNCCIPTKAGHHLECGDDPACHQCQSYVGSHPEPFLNS
jgi:hypothetical protein